MAYTLRGATTLDEICKLKRDNYAVAGFWICADECRITITQQRPGESATASVTVPRRQFNALIDFYQREQPSAAELRRARKKRANA